MSDSKRGLTERFCDYPFTHAEIHWNGSVYFCCPGWNGFRAIGNIFTDGPNAIWNSLEALEIRQGIVNGSFAGCEHHICPSIVSNSLPLRSENSDTETLRARGPQIVKLCHDDTCNLYCGSCRPEMIVANRERQEQLDRVFQEFIIPFLADAKILSLSGDGDPFASRHYRDILRATARHNTRLRIDLHTNGVLCDERAWDDCCLWGRVDNVLVSIDAATAETYKKVRRGGDFDRLLRNLNFLCQQRAKNDIKSVRLAFTVQSLNFLEMPAFVRLGRDLGVDAIFFSLIQHWDRAMTQSYFENAQVWRDDHPLMPDLLQVLSDPIFDDDIVQLGNLASLRQRSMELTNPLTKSRVDDSV